MRKLLLIIIFLTFHQSSIACDCVVYNLKKYYKSIKHIYTGEVIELIEIKYDNIDIPDFVKGKENQKNYLNKFYPKRYFAKVRVIKSFKNAEEAEIILLESNFSNCQPNYELNQKYLFFANQTKKRKMMMDDYSPWGKLENSSKNISLLEQFTEK